MAEAVLDASALPALLNSEPGADRVAAIVPVSVISTVNLSEVVAKLAESGIPEPDVRYTLEELQIQVRDFDERQAYEAGLMRPATRASGLSLGDRVCLSLAQQLNLPVMTADRAWAELPVGVDVQVIR